MPVKIFIVEGMTCKHCKARVEKGIGEIPGVEEVIADYVTGQVSIDGSHISEEKVQSAVEEAGYRFKGAVDSTAPGSDLWLS
jgi:copper chaperone CopZ